MIVSRKRKFVFFHNPKAAGTSFRASIEEYHDFGRMFWGEEFSSYLNVTVDLAHLRAWELPGVAPGLFKELHDYRTLVFVRNPFRRFMSACFEHFYKFQPDLNFINKDVETQRSMIRHLLQTKLNNMSVLSDYQLVHFSLQLWYVFLGPNRIADHVLPLLSENEDFASAYDILEVPRRTIGRERRGAPERYATLMCQEFEDFVLRFYATDFQMIDAFDHLRPLLEHRP